MWLLAALATSILWVAVLPLQVGPIASCLVSLQATPPAAPQPVRLTRPTPSLSSRCYAERLLVPGPCVRAAAGAVPLALVEAAPVRRNAGCARYCSSSPVSHGLCPPSPRLHGPPAAKQKRASRRSARMTLVFASRATALRSVSTLFPRGAPCFLPHALLHSPALVPTPHSLRPWLWHHVRRPADGQHARYHVRARNDPLARVQRPEPLCHLL